ncbi:MAG: hypothetical protein WAT67_12870 [Candidatus Contendobacter sp.]
MSINMSKKVDIYLKNPDAFQSDLKNQESIWLDNFVRPIGSHYEAALNDIKAVFEVAKQRKAEQEARLAKIDAINGLVISVLLAGVDIMSTAALKDIQILSRFSSNKGLDSFLVSSSDTATAVKNFLSQSSKFSDALLANLDDKIKGLVQTGTVTSGVAFVKQIAQEVDAAAPSDPSVSWPGPLTYQNDMTTFYSTTSRSINEAFVFWVRDSKLSASVKRSLIELFVRLPFVRPPTLSMKTFESFFKAYYEVCYWCDYISATTAYGLFNDKGVDPTRTAGIIRDGYLADTINERIQKLTGRYVTSKGGEKGDPFDIRMAWDGWVSRSQVEFLRIVRAEAYTRNVKPLLIGAGTSTTIF